MIETCFRKNKTTVNPIIDWSDDDVWAFIRSERIPYCALYDDGLKRLGCIGCPMAGKHGREAEFSRWPKFKQMYLLSFEKMLKERELRGKNTIWASPQDVFNWWMEYDVLPGQIDLFEEEE